MRPNPAVVGLVTADMNRALAFYRDLGLPIPDGAEAAPHVDVTFDNGLRMSWDTQATITAFDPNWTPATGGHRVALCFACDDAADVDATYERMTAAGHHGHRAPWDAVWRQRYAVLHDPDGNAVELFAELG
jgi:catechol 2,3-dioxygenase-like lactoylglutathione lyase family enzyme